MHVTAIIAAAGAGRRLGGEVPKQLLDLSGRTILQRSLDAFVSHPRVNAVIVVLPAELLATPLLEAGERGRIIPVAGGARRQDSVANGFRHVPAATDIVLVHDAARPFVGPESISRVIDAAAQYGAAIVAQPVRDTVKRVQDDGGSLRVVETLPRDSIFLAQTPQAFRRSVLQAAIAAGESGIDATDEAALAEHAGYAVHVVEGPADNVKITVPEDLDAARRRMMAADDGVRPGGSRIGTAYDLHRLVEGRRLIIGGVDVASPRGALGHSDADVVCHVVTDAVLGAVGLGDIGRHFPDSDPAWKDASSVDLLRRAVAMVHGAGFRVVNVDVVVVLERPKIAPHVEQMRATLAEALEIQPERVSIKGKTNEGVDAVGRGEAIAAHAVALVASDSLRSHA
jgi:2-C-methyl-D-erythritol 4-phosphate cytidylyltransferase/2-C-methyl-D-erythritol 2,4-cyclodiphosphate synthase